MNKYHSRATVCNQGHKHASKKEANRCDELALMERAGVISLLEQQPEFILQGKFKYRGKAIRKIVYRADFKYWDKEKSRFVVEEVKGFKTAVYRLKKKMLLYILQDSRIEFIEI